MRVQITSDERVNNMDNWVDGILRCPEAAPGASWWVEYATPQPDKKVLRFACPCGCGDVLSIPCKTGPKVNEYWEWDGDTMLPTLKPSIQKLTGCRWHGYLTKGVFHE